MFAFPVCVHTCGCRAGCDAVCFSHVNADTQADIAEKCILPFDFLSVLF